MPLYFLPEEDGSKGRYEYNGPEALVLEWVGEALERWRKAPTATDAHVQHLRRLSELAPELLEPHEKLGSLLAERAPEEAADAYQRAVAIAERVLPPGFRGEIPLEPRPNRAYLRSLYGLALLASRRGEHLASARALARLRAVCPRHKPALWLLGLELLRGGEYAAARTALREVAAQYAPARYELALLAWLEDDRVRCVCELRRGFLQNPYIAELLQGYANPRAIRHWHENHLTGPAIAEAYIGVYGELWWHYPGLAELLRDIYNHSEVLRERADYSFILEADSVATSPEQRQENAFLRRRLLECIDTITSARILEAQQISRQFKWRPNTSTPGYLQRGALYGQRRNGPAPGSARGAHKERPGRRK